MFLFKPVSMCHRYCFGWNDQWEAILSWNELTDFFFFSAKLMRAENYQE